MTKKPHLGLRNNSRSPGSISNAQHHDPTGTERDASGSLISIKKVVADSTVLQHVEDYAPIRVLNRDTAVQYLWVGKDGDEPGIVDATNGIALTPQFHEMFYLPASDDPTKSIAFKTSSAQVHVVIMEG